MMTDVSTLWPELVAGILVLTLLTLVLSAIVLTVRKLLMESGHFPVQLNNGQVIEGTAGVSLLRLLNQNGIALPSGCAGAGTCGLCRVDITEQPTRPSPAEKAQLARRELKQGTRLACQIKVRDALSVKVPESILVANEWQCTVSATRQLSPLIREITLDLPENETLTFNPGSYVQITAPAYEFGLEDLSVPATMETQWAKLQVEGLVAGSDVPVSRAYSLANKQDQRSELVLLIRLALPPPAKHHSVPPGIVSSWLFSTNVGDTVSVNGPFGDFQLHPSDREMVLVGGGVGMAPLWAIMHQELSSDRTRRIRFFYGARSQQDVFYREELDALAAQHPRFETDITLSEPSTQKPWNGATGFVHERLKARFLDEHPAPEDCDYYLCGPPLMQQAVVSALDDAGVEPTRIFADSFGV